MTKAPPPKTILDLLMTKMSPQDIAKKIKSGNLLWWDDLFGLTPATADQQKQVLDALRRHVRVLALSVYEQGPEEEHYQSFWDDPMFTPSAFVCGRIEMGPEEELGRRDSQVRRIQQVIQEHDYENLLHLPFGAKKAIKQACLTDPKLFTPEGFRAAWNVGLKRGLFRMAGHDGYAKNK